MVIHVVKRGETVYDIARLYGVPPERIIRDNELALPSELAVGQTLVILFPSAEATVSAGQSLSSLSAEYGIPENTLIKNNPFLLSPEGTVELSAGQRLYLGFDQPKLGELSVNGYAYPYVSDRILYRALPYLTYLTIFTYGFTESGELIGIDDRALIEKASVLGVVPLMLLSTYNGTGFSNELAGALFSSPSARERLIGEVLANIRAKGYGGLDIDFEYIRAADAENYVSFVSEMRAALEPEGYEVWVALAPKTSAAQPGLLYEGHRYRELSAEANAVLLMTYEWGYTYGPPMAVAPEDKVRQVLNYAVTEIPREKIFMGIPNYGYDWPLPYVAGQTAAKSISNYEAPSAAYANGAEIFFDETAQSPYFDYTVGGVGHRVWFEDARSVCTKLGLVREYGFRGASVWNVMRLFPQMWLVLNALYDVRRARP